MAALASVGAQAATQFTEYSLEVKDASPDNRISTGVTGEMGSATHLSFRPRAADGAAAIIVDKDVAFTGYLQIGGGSTSPQDVNITFEDSATTPYTLSVKSIQTVGSRTKPSNITVSGNGNVIVTGEANFAVESAGETTATWFFGQGGTFTTNTLSVGRLSTVTINNYDSNSNITVSDDGRLTLTGSAVNAKELSVASAAAFSSETEISVTKFNLGGLVQSGAAQKFSSVNFDGDTATLNAVAGSSFGSNFAFDGSSGYIANAISLNVTNSAKKAEIEIYKGFTGGNVLTLDSGADVTVTAQGNNQFQGNFTLGAALKNFTFTGGQLVIGENGHLTVSAAKGAVNIDGAITVKNSTVTLNSNALDGQGFAIVRGDAKLIVNTDSKLGALSLVKNAFNPNMQITLNGKSLEFASITIGDLENSYVEFLDFAEGKVRITSDLVKNEDGTLKNIFAGTGTGRQSLYQLETGYLSLSNVPEPATYAAIFGGLALLLALVKRRR